MGCRLRPRLLDRCRLFKILVTVLICVIIFGHRNRVTRSSRVHELSSSPIGHELVAAISLGRRLTATDVSQPQYAQGLCKEHGLRIFDKKPVPKPGSGRSKRKVFDLLTVDAELDWMEIRLNSTYDYVDYFVIMEGRRTTAGAGKPLKFRQNWDRFSAYHDKIIYHELQYAADFEFRRPGDLETHQRNAPFIQVFPNLIGMQSPTQGDVLLVSDVDEIVRPETLLVLRACETPRRLTLHSKLYYYTFHFIHSGKYWPHPQATTYQGMADTILPNDLRKDDGAREWGYLAPVARHMQQGDLKDAGWYCSSCFPTADDLVETMKESPMLVSMSKDHERGEDLKKVTNGQGEVFLRIEHTEDVPTAVRANTERWRNLLDRNGTSTGWV